MHTFLRQVVTPVVARVGTIVSGFLIGQGVPDQLTSQLVLAIGVTLGLAFDAVVVVLARRRTTR